MKKLSYLFLAGTLGLGFAACSNDEPVAAGGGDGMVTLTAQLPAELASRAFGDGSTATTLTYAVYESNQTTPAAIIVSEDEVNFDGLKATVNLQLVNGKTYDILFWADAPSNGIYTFDSDAQTITVDYTAMASNNDNADAFFALKTLTVSGAVNETVQLTRPFAQVNFGTDDIKNPFVQNAFGFTDADVTAGTFGTLKSGLTFKTQLPKTLNLFTGKTADVVDVTFGAVAPTVDEKGFPYEPLKHTYMSMSYILCDTEKAIVDLEYTVFNGNDPYNAIKVNAVPVQRNYRTNIYGSLLTSNVNFNVEIVPGFTDPDFDVAVTANTPSDFTGALVNPKVEIINVSTELDLSDATAAELTFTVDKTINMTEGASIILPATEFLQSETSNLTVNGGRIANVDAAGNPIVRTRADESMVGKHKSLIHIRDGKLNLKGVEIVNDPNHHWHGSQYNSSAISYWGNCEITLDSCNVISGEFALCGMGRGGSNTSKVYLKDSYFESTSSSAHNGKNWAYCMRLFGTEGVLENCEVKGTQGAVSTEEKGTFTFNGGKYYTVNSPGKTDAFYAVYATSGSKVIINDGYFYGAVKRTGLDIGGTSCIVIGDNDTGMEFGALIEVNGGHFSGKAYNHVTNEIYEDFDWIGVNGVGINWTVPAITK